MISLPPSSTGCFQLILQLSARMSVTSSGPTGREGGPNTTMSSCHIIQNLTCTCIPYTQIVHISINFRHFLPLEEIILKVANSTQTLYMLQHGTFTSYAMMSRVYRNTTLFLPACESKARGVVIKVDGKTR